MAVYLDCHKDCDVSAFSHTSSGYYLIECCVFFFFCSCHSAAYSYEFVILKCLYTEKSCFLQIFFTTSYCFQIFSSMHIALQQMPVI